MGLRYVLPLICVTKTHGGRAHNSVLAPSSSCGFTENLTERCLVALLREPRPGGDDRTHDIKWHRVGQVVVEMASEMEMNHVLVYLADLATKGALASQTAFGCRRDAP
jgi:hypothetical protein